MMMMMMMMMMIELNWIEFIQHQQLHTHKHDTINVYIPVNILLLWNITGVETKYKKFRNYGRVHTDNFTRRVPFPNGTRRVASVHTASTASTAPGSSDTLRPHREVFSVDANSTRRVGAAVWMIEWTRRVRQRHAVCACLQTDLFISIPLICRNHDTVLVKVAEWQQKSHCQMFPRLKRDQHVIQWTHDPKNVIYANS